jgi:c-di-GMP-binding flagellar brake protein YcgR
MIKQMPNTANTEERRRFERIDITPDAQIVVMDQKGRKAGVLRQLARGGFAMEAEKSYAKDSKVYEFTIHEPTEDIRVDVSARVRFAESGLVGFEFIDLTPDSAVEVGVIIGKYYEQNKG